MHCLPQDDPLYYVHQGFVELACRSREEDPDKLVELAWLDHVEVFDAEPGPELESLFKAWSKVHAKLNIEINLDPECNP